MRSSFVFSSGTILLLWRLVCPTASVVCVVCRLFLVFIIYLFIFIERCVLYKPVPRHFCTVLLSFGKIAFLYLLILIFHKTTSSVCGHSSENNIFWTVLLCRSVSVSEEHPVYTVNQLLLLIFHLVATSLPRTDFVFFNSSQVSLLLLTFAPFAPPSSPPLPCSQASMRGSPWWAANTICRTTTGRYVAAAPPTVDAWRY